MDGPDTDLGLVLGGGGARAAFQVGVLHAVARRFPEARLPVLTGVSAGAINTAFLANHPGSLEEATGELGDVWKSLGPHRIFEVGVLEMLDQAARIGLQFVLGRPIGSVRGQGIVDTAPLRSTLNRVLHARDGNLAGVRANLAAGRLRAVALTATSYTTGQTVTFFEGGGIEGWERPNRKAVRTRLTVDHVMASSALPVFFPPVRVDGAFYGDGGIRLIAPFAPAIHLGAARLLAVSTRYARSRAEADVPVFRGPPSAAQLLGVLYAAIFL
ncbi:MAG TPA: patatin-like phospholipase family protein, partial [bacterium]|nr:patatin-like phospholipase family protein [bacterium]